MMLRDEYVSELDYLYQLTGEVAEKHPADAPMLGRDASPGVSRLVQTAAFLFARLRQRLDDDLPEVIHPVIESVFPSLLRPTPSATIMELRPTAALKAPLVVPQGALFATKPIDGAPCHFRSTTEALVLPWRLDRVDLADERRELRLAITMLPGAKLDLAAASLSEVTLRLFLAGPPAMALDARSALLRGVRDVSAHDARGRVVSLVGSGPLLGRVAASSADAVAPTALSSLRWYFAWPASFAFIDVPHVERALPLLAEGERLELRLRLEAPIARSIRLDADTVRLHCLPAINVQRLAGNVPVPLRGRRCVLPLPRPGMQVHSIGKVTLVHDDLSTRPAVPFAAFFPPIVDPDGEPQITFATERRPAVVGTDPVVSLAFQGPGLERVRAAKVEADAIDGVRAERIGLGDVSVVTTGSPPLVTFENITPVSRSLPPAFDDDRLWRWFQIMKAPLHELATHSGLARCLALANGPAWAEWPDAKPDARAFAALTAVRMHTETQGARTAAVAIDVDLGGFAGLGDADLFGELVQQVLATTLRPHERVEVTIGDAACTPVFRYAAIAGTREGL